VEAKAFVRSGMSKIENGRIYHFLQKGHTRSVKAKKNILASFGLKGFSILISFLLVPLTLDYLDPTRYGLWLTISGVVGWLTFFDIGLGNGLRNKLAEALAVKDYELARAYVSTAYIILTAIIGIIYLLFLLVNPWLNWSSILNTDPGLNSELKVIVLVVVTFFALRFMLKQIGVIFVADQNPSVNNALSALGNATALIGIYIVTKVSSGNLLYVSFVYSASPVIILIIASFYFFRKKYFLIRPSLKYVHIKYFNSLAGLGVKFFILQISTIVIFSTDNIIISQILGPAAVTPYNIAYKYFGIPIMVFTIIMTPFWSAFTEANKNRDFIWIKKTISKLIRLWLILIIIVLGLLALSRDFYHMWVGSKIYVPFVLSAFMALYAIISTWNNIFAYFINGVGKIKLQMYYGIIAMIINIPASIFFAKDLNLGVSGVILGTCLSLLFGFTFGPLQYVKIINGKAKGIWNE
jgi:O-antigen/teichoic acid export membrane protein